MLIIVVESLVAWRYIFANVTCTIEAQINSVDVCVGSKLV